MKKTFSMLAIVALTLVACSPEDGETGPVGPIGPEGQIGPKGDPGTDGIDGIDGTNGIDGKDGVANIKTFTYTVASGDWVTLSNGAGLFVHRDTLAVNEINAQVLNSGAVMVYRSTDMAVNWRAMPYSNLAVNYVFSYSIGSIYLEINRVDGAQVGMVNSEFKVVVIPPASLLKGVDHNDYEAVEMVYGLED